MQLLTDRSSRSLPFLNPVCLITTAHPLQISTRKISSLILQHPQDVPDCSLDPRARKKFILSPHVSNCHFCSPPLCPSLVGADLLAIFTSAVFMYSCARLAQTFLCVLVSAFLQSREQYKTLLHEIHGLSEGLSTSDEDSTLEHFAQVGVGASGTAVLGPARDWVLRRGWCGEE
jgi:hypothetical protein